MHDVVGEMDRAFAMMPSIKASCNDAAGETHACFEFNARCGMAACPITAAMPMICIDHVDR